MNNKSDFNIKKVKTIKKELLINGGDLDLYLDLYLDGEKVLTKKADSILANFLRILYLQMGRDNRDNVMGGTFYRLRNTVIATGSPGISSISSGVNNKIRIIFTSTVLDSSDTTGKITLGGFQGIPIDGQFNFTRISNSQIDLEDTTYSAGWIPGTGGVSIYVPITSIGNPSYISFASSGIIIGTGTSVVTIDDNLLEKQVPSMPVNGGLTYNASTVSQDTNDSTSAQLTFTRTFTNNASLTVQVNEIGMLMQAGTANYTLLVMRDIIPGGVNVASGKTLTVNYRIKTTLNTGTDPGGFLASFMRLLYRHAAQTTRAVFDINNSSRTNGRNHATFSAIKNGGINVEYPTNSEFEAGYKHGIVIGTGDTAVSMGDYYLTNPIAHGSGTGEMLYYGGFAEGFEIDADYAQFSIMKAIENNSGSPIQVKEYVLTVGACSTDQSFDSSQAIVYLFTATRNVLTVPVDVQDQEILKVVYTLKVIVVS